MGTRMRCVPSMSPHAGSMDVKLCKESGRRSSKGTRIARRSLMHFERRNAMNKRLGSILFVSCCLSVVPAWAQPQAGAQPRSGAQLQGDSQPPSTPAPPDEDDPQGRRIQPGAEQGRGVPTTLSDVQSKFNMDYFLGTWNFESTVSESPFGGGGTTSGSETIRNIWDGRFWDVTIKGEGPDGPFAGKGFITYADSFAGQSFVRYEVTREIGLLRTGRLGCDLGGTCSLHFETPPFEHNGSTLRLRGRYYLTSPFSYRLNTEIRINTDDYRNLGTAWYRKDVEVELPAAVR